MERPDRDQRCDVLVAGGGSAGIAAAITAARLGAKTLLVEHLGSLGGMATASLIHSICGLYRLATDPEPVWANVGFPREFASRLMQLQGSDGPARMGRVDVLLTLPTAFAHLADTMVSETRNLRVQLHGTITKATSDLSEVETFTRGQRQTIQPKCVIDATGDGTVSALAGVAFEMEPSRRLQRPAFIFGIQGLEPNALTDDARLKLTRHLACAVKEERLTPKALGATLRNSGRTGEAFASIDLPGLEDFDPLDTETLTDLEMDGRAVAVELVGFLKDEVPGFSTCFISVFPTRVGVRESRRVAGRYRLESSDLENGATFPDAVALATWPMELRETANGPRMRYPLENRPCEIPLRCLQARDHDRLFLAGRCISTSHEAQASIRVIGTCLATGEAAGIAAVNFLK